MHVRSSLVGNCCCCWRGRIADADFDSCGIGLECKLGSGGKCFVAGPPGQILATGKLVVIYAVIYWLGTCNIAGVGMVSRLSIGVRVKTGILSSIQCWPPSGRANDVVEPSSRPPFQIVDVGAESSRGSRVWVPSIERVSVGTARSSVWVLSKGRVSVGVASPRRSTVWVPSIEKIRVGILMWGAGAVTVS